ncbi:MAG: ornithine aminotransferase [Pirellula sp.]|nr:ornithine aminotransferase [Pirellula sp.]
MKTDSQLRRDVIDELEWEPSIDASQIGVAASAGVITLTGAVSRYTEKMEAERLAKSIAGVKAVANDIDVRLQGASERNDTEIAAAALNALKWHTSIPDDKVTVTVRDGWITLDGNLDWQFQRVAARNAVCHLVGVKGVSNNIAIGPKPKAADVKSKIEAAFKRKAELDAGHVQVDTSGGVVKLKGYVDSWSEFTEAERVARAAPGVIAVDNGLTIGAGNA